MDIERRLYLRLFSFCIGSAMDILSLFIDTCILNNTDFDLFLNQHKHKMFHRWIPTIPCCECVTSVSIAATNKRSILNISQMKTVYKLDGAEVTGHVKTNRKKETSQHCLCKISALPGITTENLDIGLVHCLIKTCSSTIFAKVQNHLEVIRDIRNKLAHPDRRGIMTETDFNQKWDDLENAILSIAKEVSLPFARYEKKHIASLKKTDANLEDVTDKIEYMEENMKKEFQMILDEQNKTNGLLQTKVDNIKQEILGALEKHTDLLIEIKKLKFVVKMDGKETELKSETTETTVNQREVERDQTRFKQEPSQIKSSQSQEQAVSKMCQVVWRLQTPDKWQVKQMKQTLENVSQLLRQWFHIEFVYDGSLVLHTSVPSHVIRDRQFLKSAIQSFLEKIVEVCKINTDVSETVNVDFRVIDMVSNTETVKSEVKKLARLPRHSETESSTDEDTISCKHCHKQFPCDQCSIRRNQITFLVEDNRRKTQTITDMEIVLLKAESESEDSEDEEISQLTKTTEPRKLGEPPYKMPRLLGYGEDAKTTTSTQPATEYINWLKKIIEIYKGRVDFLKQSWANCRRNKAHIKTKHKQKKLTMNDHAELVSAQQSCKRQKSELDTMTKQLRCYQTALQSQGQSTEADLEDLSTEEPAPESNTPSCGGSENQVVVLVERLSMYKTGIESAKSAGDSSKQKRYKRGLKTIQELIKKFQQGKTVDKSDIPPKINVGGSSKQTTEPKTEPSPAKQPVLEANNTTFTPTITPTTKEIESNLVTPSSSSHDQETEKVLVTRRDQYKSAALHAKHGGDIITAKTQIAKIGERFEKGPDTADTESFDDIMCQLCVSNPRTAVYWCTECVKAMCRECTTVHCKTQTSSTHTIVLLTLDYNFHFKDMNINDIASLCEGVLIISDHYGKQLITCDIRGHNKQFIPLPYSPYRLSVIDQNNIAVTAYSHNKVLIVGVRKKTITKEFDINCYGIMYRDSHLYVGCYHSLVKVDMSGEIIRTVPLSFTPEYILYSGTEGRIYCIYSNTVCCIDTEGNTVFTSTNPDMSNPTGITSDNEGHVLVVCDRSNNVHRISPDGKLCNVIIKDIPSRILSFPRICYDSRSKSIVIGLGDTVYIYRI